MTRKKSSLIERFNYIHKKFFKKIAIEFTSGKKVSFSELNKKSDKISNWLLKKTKKGDRICIVSEKAPEVFYLILGCLKTGVPYTILDKENPFLRNMRIINILKPRIIFSAYENFDVTKNYQKKIITFKKLEKILYLNEFKKQKTEKKIGPDSTAYIMFTSGSTGHPKGACITHKNLINFIKWSKKEYKFSTRDKFSNLNGLHFDNSVFDIYGSIFNGNTLISFNKTDIIDPNKFIKKFIKYKINNWFSVPSLLIYFLKFRLVTKKNFMNVKRIIFGGEAFPKKELKILFNKLSKKTSLYNVYGPTECTCICSSYKIKKKDFSKLEMNKYAPLGKKMIPNFNYKIINNNNTQKIGNKGELILYGNNVGKGYFNNKKETKKKFISLKNKTKAYKTGDIVYKDKKNKYIYFVSRSDNQIKYMGYRIELDEIEKGLNNLNSITKSVVTYGKIKEQPEITAWVQRKNKVEEISIKNSLKKILPTYMIPRNIFFLKKIPLNSNGKVDKFAITKNYYDRK